MSQTRTQSAAQGQETLKTPALPSDSQEQVRNQLGLRRNECLTLSRREAAEVLGVSTRTLDRLIEQGELRFVGSTHRLARAAVFAYVHDSKVDGHAA